MLVHELENSLGDIYTIFKEQFPEYNDLWALLIKEEHQHADAVQNLYRLTYDKKVVFDEGQIKPDGVQSVVDYLKTVYDNAQRGQYTIKQALVLSYDLERSIYEHNIFDYFTGIGELENTISFLVIETKKHAELLKEKIANLQ